MPDQPHPRHRTTPATRGRVAVVGSGIAGLTAAYLLQRRHDVLLFEADARLGGHAHTHDVPGSGRTVAVDSGFIVHNERTYPHLLRLFRELEVATQDTSMSMSVRCETCNLEYAGARGPRGLFASARTAMRPEYLRMLLEVKRFHRQARQMLDGTHPLVDDETITLDAFLAAGGYSRFFNDHFMLPLVSAVWSSGPITAGRYPARYLFQFLNHHGMLAVTGSPQWRTVVGGSRTYVERAVKSLTAVHLSTPVRSVTRTADGVLVHDDSDAVHEVDHVVIATHPDQALRLLADPTRAETEVLGALPYATNETVLHTDSSLLPRSRSAIGSWNYLVQDCGASRHATGQGSASTTDRAIVTYDMNRLHRLQEPTDFLVSMNATDRIRPDSVLARMVYAHPIYTPESLVAQTRLPELTTSRTAYAGAYHGWGFHEDGCASGAAAARAFGVDW